MQTARVVLLIGMLVAGRGFVETPTAAEPDKSGYDDGFGIVANDDDDDDGHHAEIVNSIVLSHPITGSLTGYVEFFSAVPTRHSADWEGTLDFGSTWTIGENFQFDAGLNVGVTHAADDLQPFLGASYRF